MEEKRAVMKNCREERRSQKKPLENLNSFLYKLWSLVNDESVNAIHWSQDGEKVIIDNPAKFTSKVLTSHDKKIFKTKNISSFIRQLNLYGFRRVKESSGKIPIIFKHEFFKRGRPDLLVDVKRKKPVPNKPLNNCLGTAPAKGQKTTHNHGQPFPKSRLQNLPTSQNYPYLNTSSLARRNVHMPFATPFAVNHGPTFINVGSNSTVFGKQKISERGSYPQNEESQTAQQDERKNLYSMRIASEPPYCPPSHRSYYTAQEPGNPGIHPAYGSDLTFQVMMQNQAGYNSYPPTFLNDNTFATMPRVTSYRSYGDSAESIPYPGLPNYSGPVNSMMSFSYGAPQVESPYIQTTSKEGVEIVSKFKEESPSACSINVSEKTAPGIPIHNFPGDSREQRMQCIMNQKCFPHVTAKEEKVYAEEKKE